MTTSKVPTYTDGGVIEFLCDRRFHRTFTLPPNPATKRAKPYRVSYADYGDRNSDAVVLFCGALMTNRTSYSPLDQLAKKHEVRILHPDRPGIGGSDPVGLHERIDILDDCWVRAVIDGGSDTETTGGTQEGTRCYKVWRWVLRKTNHMNLIDAGFKGSAKWLERVRASFEVAEEGLSR